MLKDAPPGTGLIISAISLMITMLLVIGTFYSWLILQSNQVTMVFVGIIVFMSFMLLVYLLRRDRSDDDDDKEDDTEDYGDIEF